MFDNIKGMMSVKDEIDRLSSAVNEATEKNKELTNNVIRSKDELKELLDEQRRANRQTEIALEQINVLKRAFEKELYDFKVLKSEIQRKVLQRFEEKLSQELHNHIENLKSDAKQYNNLKEEIKITCNTLLKITEEVHRLKEISSTIKKEDFQLTKFTNKIFAADREKVNLLKKLDSMERLVARTRRG